MIEDKNRLIEKVRWELNYVKKIIRENSALFDECKKYYDLWQNGKPDRCVRMEISDNYIGVNLALYLKEDDSMDDVNLFLDEIPYDIKKIDEVPAHKWIRYEMYVPEGALHIFCYYDNSKHCKLVETGETKPIYKRVCV